MSKEIEIRRFLLNILDLPKNIFSVIFKSFYHAQLECN